MGLCKCPKRRATNLFCFEHRVNVCEHCLVDVHEACVVQSYLSWLTDSDYDTKCLLCSESLASKETVRLKCLHNFHWSCMSTRVGNLPEGTPPTTFKCPICLDSIFPSANQTSPVIERLKEKLSSVNWGRIGLGLEPKKGLDIVTEDRHYPKKSFAVNIGYDLRPSVQTTSRVKQGNLPIESRPLQDDSDHVDIKYVKRQSTMRFGRFSKTVKRSLVILLVLGGFYLVLLMFSGRDSNENESLFDPHANPNIRVEPNNL